MKNMTLNVIYKWEAYSPGNQQGKLEKYKENYVASNKTIKGNKKKFWAFTNNAVAAVAA